MRQLRRKPARMLKLWWSAAFPGAVGAASRITPPPAERADSGASTGPRRTHQSLGTLAPPGGSARIDAVNVGLRRCRRAEVTGRLQGGDQERP